MPYNAYNGMSSELLVLRQLFSQVTPNYCQVAVLAGLLLVAIYRPERIRALGMFRAACVILAISIVVPAVTSALVTLLMTAAGNVRGSSSSDYMILLNLLNAVEPALVAISICLGIFSLLPATFCGPHVWPGTASGGFSRRGVTGGDRSPGILLAGLRGRPDSRGRTGRAALPIAAWRPSMMRRPGCCCSGRCCAGSGPSPSESSNV